MSIGRGRDCLCLTTDDCGHRWSHYSRDGGDRAVEDGCSLRVGASGDEGCHCERGRISPLRDLIVLLVVSDGVLPVPCDGMNHRSVVDRPGKECWNKQQDTEPE